MNLVIEMIKLCIFLIIVVLFVSSLSAQYDERSILTQEAQQLVARRQYSEAEQLFKQILQKFPGDLTSILQLINIYHQLSQTDKIENLLDENVRYMPASTHSEQRVLLLIMQGKPNEAMQLTRSYLELVNHNIHNYRLIASYFERRAFYEQVISLYRDARKHHGDEQLFQMEIANAALNFRLLDLAISEYLDLLKSSPNNLFFVSNQIQTILKEDSTLVSIIEKKAIATTESKDPHTGSSSLAEKTPVGNQIVLELLANAYTGLRKYDQALEIYKKLPEAKLVSFASIQFSALNDDIALPAYQYLIQVTDEPLPLNDYRYNCAQIFFRNNALQAASDTLDVIISDKRLLEWSIRNRTGVNYNARKLKAEISLIQNAPTRIVLEQYNEARSFARNPTEIGLIDLDITRLLIIKEDFNNAISQLSNIRDPKQFETREYYKFLVALMQSEIALADSMMNEYIITYPSGLYVNDAIYLMMLIFNMSDEDKTAFSSAYRKFLAHESDAIKLLITIFEHNNDEELLILAIEWAIAQSNTDQALELLKHDWEDEVAREYAAALTIRLALDKEHEQRLAREFLAKNPNSIFSPGFRQVLSRAGSQKPNL